MYKSFEIRNFRCFDHLKIDDLERVNLIAGVNNVGKTAFLEALFLHCGAYRPQLTLTISGLRGIETLRFELGQKETPWDSLFAGFDTSRTVELTGVGASGQRVLRLEVIRSAEQLAELGVAAEHGLHGANGSSSSLQAGSPSPEIAKVLRLEYEEAGRKGEYYLILDAKGERTQPIPPAPPYPAFLLGARTKIPFEAEAERYGKLQQKGEEDVVLEALRLIEPRLKRLTMIVVAGKPMLHGDLGLGRLVPLPILGEGMTRLATLVIHIGNTKDGVVLVDEIENGLHHSVLPKVWRALGEAARKFNAQVLATTHSLECIEAAHKAFSENEHYDFRLHRLDRAGDTIRAVTYDREALAAAIETGLEVR